MTAPANYSGGETVPTIRQGPQDDGSDALRVKLVKDRWHAQDMFLIERDRSVEDNCRMLMGDQWSIWSPRAQRRINLSDAFGGQSGFEELPRINRVQKWYGLTLSRMTENAPVLGAEPRDSDHESVALAQAADVILPKVWDDCGMTGKTFEVVGWMAAAGWGFMKVFAETAEGKMVPMVGPAVMPAPDGSQVPVEHAAFDRTGQPMGRIVQQDDGSWGYHLGEEDGEPGELTEGRPSVRVLGALECRGEWGNHIPWQEKRWHTHLSFQTPEGVKSTYGCDCQPDTSVDGSSVMQNYRLRLERGTGHYGVTDTRGIDGPTGSGPATELCAVYEMWERPSSDFPEGRLLIVTGNTVLFDGVRPFPKLKDYGYTSPIVYAEWLRQAARGYGTTPLEGGVPIQRQINAGWRQLLLHRKRVTNPIVLYDRGAGLTEEDIEAFSTPGSQIGIEVPGGATTGYKPVWFISPDQISKDVYEIQDRLNHEFDDLMGLAGAEGIAQGSDASGEQVKELRFNSDRPISVPVRNLATALEQVGNLMFCVLPVVWPTQQMVHYMGDDNLARTMTILPEMWDGQVHVRIDAESMLPRSRQEREQQAAQRYQLGIYGPPGSPQAASKYMLQTAYPDIDQLNGPDGPDRPTMNRLIGMVMQGMDPRQIPMQEQWNYGVMRQVLRDHMSSPEFLKADTQTQAMLQLLWVRVEQAEMAQAVKQAQQQTQVQGAIAAIQAPLQLGMAHVAGAAQQIASPPPPPESAAPTASTPSGD